jgi:hypothetical protein
MNVRILRNRTVKIVDSNCELQPSKYIIQKQQDIVGNEKSNEKIIMTTSEVFSSKKEDEFKNNERELESRIEEFKKHEEEAYEELEQKRRNLAEREFRVSQAEFSIKEKEAITQQRMESWSKPPASKMNDDSKSGSDVTVQQMRGALSAVSDALIAPRHFTGKTGEDAESWLDSFDLYTDHKKLNDDDKRTLFRLMMRECAADYFSTQPPEIISTFDGLREAFKANYFGLSELDWKIRGTLWSEVQKDNERVDDFVMRIRKGACRLKLDQQTICDIVLNGLRPALRMHCVQQGEITLESLIKTARLAEALVPAAVDHSAALILDAVRESIKTAERQASEIRSLATQVMGLKRSAEEVHIVGRPTERRVPEVTPKPYRWSPQAQQRDNYARQVQSRVPVGEARPYPQQRYGERSNPHSPAGGCSQCGLRHAEGNCRANGAECRRCGKLNHFARVCRSARQ